MGYSMGSYKLNTSGVSSGDQGSSGYGGILRDENGRWIRGFTGHLGTGSMCIEAELLAILKGVDLIDSLRLQNTTLETDSLDAFKAYEKPDMYTKSSVWMTKISDCQKLVKKNEITLSSITPEENKCARFLAELAMDEEEDDDDDYADKAIQTFKLTGLLKLFNFSSLSIPQKSSFNMAKKEEVNKSA
ncbi:unnamed protein product [Lactuca saligna]|uniref:RNase H type-1 domain-containing protein n=1 Tax=Lactuca saligna TaxID=75948 RepID=A0AA35YI81_LACSI|nr:unnamed protein product [Lactuca saligna]